VWLSNLLTHEDKGNLNGEEKKFLEGGRKRRERRERGYIFYV